MRRQQLKNFAVVNAERRRNLFHCVLHECAAVCHFKRRSLEVSQLRLPLQFPLYARSRFAQRRDVARHRDHASNPSFGIEFRHKTCFIDVLRAIGIRVAVLERTFPGATKDGAQVSDPARSYFQRQAHRPDVFANEESLWLSRRRRYGRIDIEKMEAAVDPGHYVG